MTTRIPHPYVILARKQIEAFAREKKHLDPMEAFLVENDESLWQDARACFVSIKNEDGSLRGCIGTILPATKSIAREIISNAVSAASRDPRFPPVQADELGKIHISVDVLSLPEPVNSLADLDPKKYGVIVSREMSRGVLLPDLDGVDTVEDQLRIACMKAGIHSFDGVNVERFTVDRYREKE